MPNLEIEVTSPRAVGGSRLRALALRASQLLYEEGALETELPRWFEPIEKLYYVVTKKAFVPLTSI